MREREETKDLTSNCFPLMANSFFYLCMCVMREEWGKHWILFVTSYCTTCVDLDSENLVGPSLASSMGTSFRHSCLLGTAITLDYDKNLAMCG